MRPLMAVGLAGALDDRRVVLVHDHLLGPAEVLELDVLELDAQVLEDRPCRRSGWRCPRAWPCGGRRSPAPSPRSTESVPRSLLTTSVASASPSTSSAMIRSGLPGRATFSSTGTRSLIDADLLLVDQDEASSRTASIVSGSVTKYGRQVAAVELHPLDDLEVGLHRLALLDGDDAVLADLLHRLGDHLADRSCRCWRRWWRPGRSPSCPWWTWTSS